MNKILTLKPYFLLPIDQQADIAKVIIATCNRFFNEGYSASLCRRKTQIECKVNSDLVDHCIRGTELFQKFLKRKVQKKRFIHLSDVGHVS